MTTSAALESAPISDTVGRTARVWSALQLAIFDDVATGTGHTVVRARAGTGKTTVIVESFRRIPTGLSIVSFAFNTKICDELTGRVNAAGLPVLVTTLHKYGFTAVRSAFGNRVRVDNSKVSNIIKDMSHLAGEDKDGYRRALVKLVSLAKGTLAKDDAELSSLIDEFELDFSTGYLEELRDQLDRASGSDYDDLLAEIEDLEAKIRVYAIEDCWTVLDYCKSDTSCVDFDDMIWLPVVLRLRTRQYDRVFIDELQDLNACQIQLAMGACRKGGRICGVGDDRQAIYRFRGADSRALPRFIEATDAKVLPLSITYRCPRAVVALAQTIVPDYESGDGAPEGEILELGIKECIASAQPGDFIVSRTKAPLLGACFGLLKRGVPARITGRDIAGEIVALIQKSKKRDVASLTTWVEKWRKNETKRLLARNPDADTTLVDDRAECVHALCEGHTTVASVLVRLEGLFADEKDATANASNVVTLSTTHKAKGLEADRVFVLIDTYRPTAGIEEANLYYVAITRAKSVLGLVVTKKAA